MVGLIKNHKFSLECEVLSCNYTTSKIYGEIKNDLRSNEKPIPENDIWIAAITKQYRLTLVSRDAHFSDIDGLFRKK